MGGESETPPAARRASGEVKYASPAQWFLKTPFYGSPRMTWWLNEQGYRVNPKRVARLMRVMGLQATLPGPHTSRPRADHVIYPYLLRGMEINAPCEVWSADITYIPMRRGFMFLVAVIDWFSRYVIAWDVSNSMESGFCVTALKRALKKARPNIFNTDQGCQFTSDGFTGTLTKAGVRISMDGRGRALDNVFIERLWRSVKYEDIYLQLKTLDIPVALWLIVLPGTTLYQDQALPVAAHVSVTQQFNSATSMGRLTLNVLLSFAQFEREMISERTRDKMAAARKKGKYVGGRPMLGYDVAPKGGRLMINEEEAHQVRTIWGVLSSMVPLCSGYCRL